MINSRRITNHKATAERHQFFFLPYSIKVLLNSSKDEQELYNGSVSNEIFSVVLRQAANRLLFSTGTHVLKKRAISANSANFTFAGQRQN